MKAEIELQSIKLQDGARILRFSDARSGLCLEKKVEPSESIAHQTQRWREAFVALLEREMGATG